MVYRDIKTINIPSNDLDILQVEYTYTYSSFKK